MHGDVFAEFLQFGFVAVRFESDQNADFAQIRFAGVVNVRGDNAVADFQHGGAAQVHVFADFRNQVGQAFFKGFVNFRALKSLHVADFAVVHQSNQSGIGNIFLKHVVLGDKVGFGVYFDNGAFVAVNGNRNQTFGRNAAGLFGSRSQAFFAQPVNGGFHVAVSFGQGFFAVQHAGTGAFS